MIGRVTLPSRKSRPDGLAERRLLALEIQQVVDELEGHAQAEAVVLNASSCSA